MTTRHPEWRGELNDRLGIDGSDPGPYALFVGRFRWYKGIDTLLEAYAMLSPDEAGPLVIAGSGELSDREQEGLQALRGRPVSFVNSWLSDGDLAGLVSAAQFVVLPYRSATQSGVIPLASAFGIPAIASATGGLVEQVVDGETGWLFPPGEQPRSRRPGPRVRDGRGDYRRMSARCREYAATNWSWDVLSRRLLASAKRSAAKAKPPRLDVIAFGSERSTGSPPAHPRRHPPVSKHRSEHRGPWVVEQVDALAASTDIGVLCCSQTATDRTEVRPSGVRVTFRPTRTVFGGGRLGLLASSVRYDRALAAHIRTNPGIGLLHAHFGIPDAIVVRRHAARAAIPYVVTLHGDDAFKVLPRQDPIGGAVRRAVMDASAVICVSDAMARAVTSVLDVQPVVIPNGYDDALFKLSEQPRDLGLLFVGTSSRPRTSPFCSGPMPGVRATIAMPLTIVGDGPLRRP